MSVQFTSDQWWKNGVMYCLDIETFLDWDGDGVGDMAGLVQRIDYPGGLGHLDNLVDAVLPVA